MNCRIKALGLALAATFALTAVTASAASAQFTSNKTHTLLSGSQEGSHKFTAGSGFGAVTCSTASFSGTSAGTNSADQTITPTYSGCKDSFNRTVDIDNSGLTYTFTATTAETPNGIVHTWGTVHLSGSMVLTVTSGGGSVICTVVITVPQSRSGIVYDNLIFSGVRVTADITSLETFTSGGPLNCGISNGAHTDGTYTGTTVITGKDTSGAAATISVD